MKLNALLACMAALAACASLGPRTPEPGKIVLRNSTGRALRSMSVREDTRGGETPARLGTISPAMHGHDYAFGRRKNPPPLAAQVIVTWQERSGRRRSTRVRIDTVLRDATGAPGESLFFELSPGGRVVAYLGKGQEEMK